jgi:hypothetical protein
MAQPRFDSSQDHEAQPQPQHTLSCRRCNAPTARDTLSLLGGRCSACYAAYCAEPLKGRVGPDPQRVQLALPRAQVRADAGHISSVLGSASPQRAAQYAADLGIDIPDEYRQPHVSDRPQDTQQP